MGLVWRKRLRLGKGMALNLSKSGASVSKAQGPSHGELPQAGERSPAPGTLVAVQDLIAACLTGLASVRSGECPANPLRYPYVLAERCT